MATTDTTRVYEVVHTDVSITIVRNYIADPTGPAFGYQTDPESFLNVQNTQGITNRAVIEATYTTKDEKDTYVGKPTSQLLLKIGTRLAIEQQKVNREGLLTQGFKVASTNIPAFKAQALADLESKESYAVVDNQNPISGKLQRGSVTTIFPDMTIWIWCRALTTDQNPDGQIFNITPFIQKVSTSMTEVGGNFSLQLPPLVCERSKPTKDQPYSQWIIKKSSIVYYQTNKNVSLQNTGYVAEESLFAAPADAGGALVRNQFLFHTLLSSNDLVFIRFETLKTEAAQRITDNQGLYIGKKNLPGRIYDMIGLINMNSITVNPASTDVSIDIQGTDLSKLVIEDGAYVFNFEMSQGFLGGPGSATNKNGLVQRLGTEQALQYLSLYYLNTIDKVFKFVLNQLSNIKIIPDSVLSAYGDRRNTKFITNQNKGTDNSLFNNTDSLIAQYKQQAISTIASVRQSEGFADPSPQIESTQVQSVYNEYFRFLQDIRTQGVRKVSNNTTTGWTQFDYTNDRGVNETVLEDAYPVYFTDNIYNVRQSRLVPEGAEIDISIDSILDLQNAKNDYKDDLKVEIAPGIWAITKLVFDESLSQRKIVDSSLSAANGSLYNFFEKVCQKPFVESYMDTYGDMYYFVIRKPPVDKIGITSMLQSQIVTENGTYQLKPAIIDVEPDAVLYEQLNFNDDEVYSWYHLVPEALFAGNASSFSLSYLPAVFLQEYADIWGSRPYEVHSNYLFISNKDTKKEASAMEEQAIEDLRFMIESTAYLPFSRRGTIKVNGDRRIKVGNFIRYKSTGEIFKVDAVRNDFSIDESSIDRTTTVEVSRGLVEQLVYGIRYRDQSSGEETLISYFNIVDLDQDSYKDVTRQVTSTVQSGSGPSEYAEPDTDATPEVPDSLSSFASDQITLPGNQNLQLLDAFPNESKSRFVQFINATNALGWFFIITSGVRDKIQQLALKKQNDKNATPGHSKHELKLAIDVNLINGGVQLTSLSSKSAWQSSGVPQVAETLGIGWGGESFKNYYDPIHFELMGGPQNKISTATNNVPKYTTTTNDVTSQQIDLDKTVSNFKVNPQVFNFFLRKEQLSREYMTVKTKFSQSDGTKQDIDNKEPVIIVGKRNNQ